MKKDDWTKKRIDWEDFGNETAITAEDEAAAIDICALHLQAYQDQQQPTLSRLNAEIDHRRANAEALHSHLYDRPVPVKDASMLKHSLHVRIISVLCLLTAAACFVGNFATFWLMGYGLVVSFLASAGLSSLPVGIGHLAYERIVARHKGVQVALVVLIAALAFGAVFQLGRARSAVMDKATAQAITNSYVDDDTADDAISGPRPEEDTESRTKGTLGGAAFMITLAAELALGVLVGLFVQLRTDEDYATWQKLKRTLKKILGLQQDVAESLSRIETAKKQCMAGIRRGQSKRNKRRPPYHKALVAFVLFAMFAPLSSYAQSLEVILIDTSGSISRPGSDDLFQRYLHAAKKLLITEPPNSRVWVSTIADDSFGGVREIVKGWTPEAHGIFTDDLNRARRQLARSFEPKSAELTARAPSTDIFGGLWHAKAVFESVANRGARDGSARAIWIFSDMVNETKQFPIVAMTEIGAERMLERAKAAGFVVPLRGYKIHVYGASPSGLTPQAWMTVRQFWEMYFAAAGAELVIYSAECDVSR